MLGLSNFVFRKTTAFIKPVGIAVRAKVPEFRTKATIDGMNRRSAYVRVN